MAVRVGTDLVSVEEVRDSLRTHAGRYLERVFTPREVADCSGPDGVEPHRLAARFAAKEAAMKVLRVGPDEVVPWPSIEVVRTAGGWTELTLHGHAAELASAAGFTDLAVSVTHENGYASAVVVAEVAAPGRYFRHER